MPPFPIRILADIADRAGVPAAMDAAGMLGGSALTRLGVPPDVDVVGTVAGGARELGIRAGVLPEPPPPPPPPPSGPWAVVMRAQAFAGPAARAVVGEAHAMAGPAARAVAGPMRAAGGAVAGPAQAVATPAARALAGPAHAVSAPAARALAAHLPPPPPRVDAARAASARMARGSGGLVIPERLAERMGLPSGHHAAATPGIGPIVGLRDLAVGFLVIASLDDPLRLRAATALAAAVDAFDSASLAAPFAARRLVGGAAMRGGALAIKGADLWQGFLSSGQAPPAGQRRVRQLPPPRAPRVTLPRA